MVARLAANGVALGGQQTVQSCIDLRAIDLHGGAVQGADIVEIDVDRQPVQGQVKDVQRRAALQDQPVRQDGIAGDLL
nr:hypothetical protein [Phenylobacterium sp. J367]